MKIHLLILAVIVLALTLSTKAQADVVVTGIQVDSKQVSMTVSTGECQVKLVPSAQITQMTGLDDIQFQGILVTVNPVDYNCSPERIVLAVQTSAPLNDLISSALESLPKEQRSLPLRIQVPPIVTNFAYGVN